tara:strand:+ start:1034 stop:1249 length:216 start_codon:yes stop_codon:yes gene_type:complete
MYEMTPEQMRAAQFRRLRCERDRLLGETDWTQGADVPDAIKSKYTEYRQALRDLPENTADPDNPTWPTKPS